MDPMMARESVVINSDALPRSHRPVTPGPIHTLVTAPLIVRGEMIGLLNAEAAKPDQFTSEDGQHLRLFADQVAATLQHLRLISSLENERNRLKTVNSLSHALTETLNLREVAARALGQIGVATHADAGLLLLWEEVSGALVAVAAEGYSEALLPELNRDLRQRNQDVYRRLSELAAGRSPVLGVAGSHWDGIGRVDQTWATALEVPLKAHGELLGMLSLFSKNSAGFQPDEVDLVTALSVPIALAIQNARFYEHAASQAKAMEDALRRQEELDRLKNELIQNVSHELRTPLALVLGYAEMLNSGQLGVLSDEQADAIEIITRRSRMLRRLVEDIALMWHLEQSQDERELLDLDEVVTTTADEFQSQAASKTLTLTCGTPGKPALIDGVPLQIRRVLDNLIGNALKFTPAGGTVAVQLRLEGDWAVISTSDDGIGVPREKLNAIFERFYQVDGSARRSYAGTGLGLALVKAIVEAHSGEIYAESPITEDPERPGTRVSVLLPLTLGDREP